MGDFMNAHNAIWRRGHAACAVLSGGMSLVLVNNGYDPITVGSNGSFQLDAQVATGAGYAVTVSTQPLGETCTVASGSDTIDQAGDAVTSVVVNCYSNGTTP